MANFTSFDKLLEAMSKIADSSDSKLKYDKTVIMEIVKLLDAETGRYAVKYQGNTLEAFAAKVDDKYNAGDSVYIKIPEGDFTNTKIIEGKVNNKTSDEQERNTISNTIVDIEPSWFSENVYGALAGQLYELVSGGETTSILAWDRQSTDKENPQYTMADTLLKTYNKEYDKFIIKASFMTSFLGAHTTGNYGLILTLRLVDVEGKEDYIKRTYVLDTTSFTGNVYQLSSYSPQYAVFQIPKNSFLGVESLAFFQDGMEKDMWKRADGENEEEITTPNIFVKDISVNFVDILDYTQDKYFVFLDTPRGNTFTEKTSQDIIVSPRLLYKGENLISDSSCEVQWFKENPNIQVNSPLYVAAAGCGWQPLEVEDKILTIKKNDVIIEKRYKVLITYGSKKSLFTKIITIYNTCNEDKKYDGVNILRDTVGNKTYLYIENQEYKGTWYRELPDGSYIGLANGVDKTPWEVKVFEGKYDYAESDTEHKNPIELKNKSLSAYNKIDVSEWLSYNTVTFYCDVYENQNKFLTTKNYTITHLDEDSDVTVNFVGENVYHYDANGDIAIEESEKDRTIDGKITWREGLGTAFKVEWFDVLGNQIETGTTGTRSNNSMLRDVYVDGNNVLHYKISSKYYNYYTNNNFKMKITTITGKEYVFPCDIIFAKDGEPGTNGTTYITMIRPVDKDGNLDTDYKVLHSGNLGQRFKAYVYKDGKEITKNDENYTIAYEWSEENISFDGENNANKNTKNDQIIQISSLPEAPKHETVTRDILDENGNKTGEKETITLDTYDIKGYVLKVAVTITDNTTDNRRRVITYYNLPIAVAFGSNFNPQLFNTNIPNFIQYNSDGTTASYTYTELTGNYGESFFDFSKTISYAKDAIDINNVGDKYYLKPVNNYYYQSGSAAIKLVLSDNLYVVYTIMMYRNAFGNATINGWDGTQLKLDKDGNYLLAAMVGAGKKNSDNTFTGIVMGTVKKGSTESDGLYGYNEGIRTFELDAKTGNAYFGANREISILANSATIQGNSHFEKNGVDVTQNMVLTLSANSGTTKAINVNNGNFSVDYDGKMIAQQAEIYGSIFADGGTIGGWNITKNSISNGATTLDKESGIMTNYIQIIDSTTTGYIGAFSGYDGIGATNCIGITSSGPEGEVEGSNSIVLQTPKYIRLSANRIYFDTPTPNDQHGVYARFA